MESLASIDDYSDYYHDEIFMKELNPELPKEWHQQIWLQMEYVLDVIHNSSRMTTTILSIIIIYYVYTFVTRKFPQFKCGLLFRGRFLSLKRLKKRYELLSIPGRYRFAGKEEGAEPIDIEYKADEDELKLIRKIRYKLKFEQDKIGN
ncbi:uncharacterized protein LOC113789417 [Dermatophagoides pteronyssinus]|uniref:uncharacterized protein LOC113789417 n=1 Tax=Dermatophagoides pteronyssinus TaxID=6956 RepID=UPI003F665612